MNYVNREAHDLEVILQYGLQQHPMQEKAYKIALLWLDISRKECPGYKFNDSLGQGDPRKSQLFKICYKLAIESKGLIEDEDYDKYITAQIRTLKNYTDGRVHAMISAQCLVGTAAWARWRKWKEDFDRQSDAKQSDNLMKTTVASSARVKDQLDRTKKFFTETMKERLSFETIRYCVEKRLIRKWILFKKVSPYWAVMSPWCKRALGVDSVEEALGIDLGVYRPSCTDDIRDYFREHFAHEFPAQVRAG